MSEQDPTVQDEACYIEANVVFRLHVSMHRPSGLTVEEKREELKKIAISLLDQFFECEHLQADDDDEQEIIDLEKEQLRRIINIENASDDALNESPACYRCGVRVGHKFGCSIGGSQQLKLNAITKENK